MQIAINEWRRAAVEVANNQKYGKQQTDPAIALQSIVVLFCNSLRIVTVSSQSFGSLPFSDVLNHRSSFDPIRLSEANKQIIRSINVL